MWLVSLQLDIWKNHTNATTSNRILFGIVWHITVTWPPFLLRLQKYLKKGGIFAEKSHDIWVESHVECLTMSWRNIRHSGGFVSKMEVDLKNLYAWCFQQLLCSPLGTWSNLSCTFANGRVQPIRQYLSRPTMHESLVCALHWGEFVMTEGSFLSISGCKTNSNLLWETDADLASGGTSCDVFELGLPPHPRLQMSPKNSFRNKPQQMVPRDLKLVNRVC